VEYPWDADYYQIGYYLKDAIRGKHDLRDQYMVYNDYNAHNLFYIHMLNERGVNTKTKNVKLIEPGNVVFTSYPSVKDYIQLYYEFEVLAENDYVTTYKIYARKEPRDNRVIGSSARI